MLYPLVLAMVPGPMARVATQLTHGPRDHVLVEATFHPALDGGRFIDFIKLNDTAALPSALPGRNGTPAATDEPSSLGTNVATFPHAPRARLVMVP